MFEKQYKSNLSKTLVSSGTQKKESIHVNYITSGLLEIHSMNDNNKWHLKSGEGCSVHQMIDFFNHKIILIPERRGEEFSSQEFVFLTKKVLIRSLLIKLKI